MDRQLPGDVYLVVAVWKDVCAKYDLTFVEDLRGASKLVKCIWSYVDGWKEWDVGRKAEWVERFLEWVVVNGKGIASAWKSLVVYLDQSVGDEGVKKVVEAYRRYVKERFGKDVVIDEMKSDVVKAARTIMKVAKEMGLSVEDVIRYQHECWEKIDKPLVFERMSDESRVKRRIQVYLDLMKKSGAVVGGETAKVEARAEEDVDKKVEELKSIWKTVLQVGVMFYTKKPGFIGAVARECWEKIVGAKNLVEKLEIIKEYSVEKVVERWLKEGRPKLFE